MAEDMILCNVCKKSIDPMTSKECDTCGYAICDECAITNADDSISCRNCSK